MTTWQIFELRLRNVFSLRSPWRILFSVAVVALLAGFLVSFHAFFKAAVDFGYDSLPLDLSAFCAATLAAAGGFFIILSRVLPDEAAGHTRRHFLANALFAWFGTAVITLLCLLPATILFAANAHAWSLWLFIRLLYVTLTFSILPLCAAAVLSLIAVFFVKRIRSRRTFAVIGSCLVLIPAAVGLIYLLICQLTSTAEGGFFADLFTRHWTTLNALSVPPISWAAFGIHAGGLTSWLSLACLTYSALAAGLISYLFGLLIDHIAFPASKVESTDN